MRKPENDTDRAAQKLLRLAMGNAYHHASEDPACIAGDKGEFHVMLGDRAFTDFQITHIFKCLEKNGLLINPHHDRHSMIFADGASLGGTKKDGTLLTNVPLAENFDATFDEHIRKFGFTVRLPMDDAKTTLARLDEACHESKTNAHLWKEYENGVLSMRERAINLHYKRDGIAQDRRKKLSPEQVMERLGQEIVKLLPKGSKLMLENTGVPQPEIKQQFGLELNVIKGRITLPEGARAEVIYPLISEFRDVLKVRLRHAHGMPERFVATGGIGGYRLDLYGTPERLLADLMGEKLKGPTPSR